MLCMVFDVSEVQRSNAVLGGGGGGGHGRFQLCLLHPLHRLWVVVMPFQHVFFGSPLYFGYILLSVDSSMGSFLCVKCFPRYRRQSWGLGGCDPQILVVASP